MTTHPEYDCVDAEDVSARERAILHQQWRAAEMHDRATATKSAVDIAGSLHHSARRNLKETQRIIAEILKEH